MKQITSSFIVFLVLSIWLVSFRANNIVENEISWDVFGYYLPLQATFIEGDPMLHQREWVDELNAEHQLSGTVYQVSSNHDGVPMYFFLFGMSYLYSIFFAIGHVLASWLGYAQNGLSPPYQYALVYGCMIYTIIGLYFFRKVLKHFFSETVVCILLVVLVLGTNYSHHMTLKNLETVNVLFMFTAIILWNTIRWYDNYKTKNIVAIGVCITLMALAKPSEVLIVLLPVLWGLTSLKGIGKRLQLFWNYRLQFIIAIGICLILAFPQMYYWYAKTGRIIFDTYKNPGVGLDVFSPHLFDSLLSYRKGWLLYTPIMVFALVGYYFLYKRRRSLFLGLFIPFVVGFYIIASWTEFWYGAGFSNRPVISLYPLLFIPFGFFLTWLFEQKIAVKSGVLAVMAFFLFLNQFQWWQMRNYILDPYRTTRAYYWSTFLATSVTPEQNELKLISRDFTGKQEFNDRSDYFSKMIEHQDVVDVTDGQNVPVEYSYTQKVPYHELTEQDHCWVEVTFDYQVHDTTKTEIYLSMMMDRSNGSYATYYYPIVKDSVEWSHFSTCYLTPEVRSVNDQLKYFFWNPSMSHFEVKNFTVKVYQKKSDQ